MQTCLPWNSARRDVCFRAFLGSSIWRWDFVLMEGCEVCKDSLWFKPMISYILWLNPSLVEPGEMFSLWFRMASPLIYVERPTGVPSRNGLSIRKPWKKSPFEPVFGSKWFSLKTSFWERFFLENYQRLSMLKWHTSIYNLYVSTIQCTQYNDISCIYHGFSKKQCGAMCLFVKVEFRKNLPISW